MCVVTKYLSVFLVGASSKFFNFLFQSCEFVGNGVLWLVLASYALWVTGQYVYFGPSSGMLGLEIKVMYRKYPEKRAQNWRNITLFHLILFMVYYWILLLLESSKI